MPRTQWTAVLLLTFVFSAITIFNACLAGSLNQENHTRGNSITLTNSDAQERFYSHIPIVINTENSNDGIYLPKKKINSAYTLNIFGECRKITKVKTDYGVFIPTWLQAEWNSFIGHAPPSVTLTDDCP